jgi:hypothetical protein
MLRVHTLPGSLGRVLETFRPCFTTPTFATFVTLLAGMIARPAHRTVCGMLAGAGLAGVWHHSRAHRFFAAARWHPDRLGLTVRCLWRGVFGARPVRVLVLTEPRKPDLALVTTDLATPVAGIVERYAGRWSIEVTFEDAKQTTGVGEARNRTPKAVERTVPFGLYTQSVVIVWYHLAGHHPSVVRDRRHHAPW